MRLFYLLLVFVLLFNATLPINAGAAIAGTADAPQLQHQEDTGQFNCIFISDTSPQFPGGDAAMKKFIHDRLYYPKEAEDVQGRVMLQFIVREDGSIDSIRVVRSLHPQLDSIAVNIVKQMPPWKPGNNRYGKVQKTTMTLPLKFTPE